MSYRMNVEQTSRTIICSVVFVDLVEYSKKPVGEQLAIKDRFTALLAETLKDIAVNDRIVLDTGDGAAMSFLGDPEDALFVGMSVRDRMKNAQSSKDSPVRIGINLGPVRLVRDINGHPNIVGDGINVAQRIMSFATPGQVLVSRSYYDAVSCLSEEYSKLFSYDGARTDKHVRAHEVYVVGESESAFLHAKAGLEHRAAQTNPKQRVPTGAHAAAAQPGTHKFSTGALRKATIAFLRDGLKVWVTGGVLSVIVLALAAALMMKPLRHAQALAAATAEPSKQDGVEKVSAVATSAAAGATAPAKTEPAKADAAKPVLARGTLELKIEPWGEIYINGKKSGVSPPIKSLKLAPGKYKVEIRNTGLAPRVEVVQVKSDKTVTIQHKFGR
jgi:class 3 adenylate cyclase